MNKIEAMIWSVLQRPEMYTLTGSYEEVVSFLRGYYSGIALDHRGDPDAAIWHDFTECIRQLLNVPTSRVFEEFRQIHGINSLDSLRTIYDSFHRNRVISKDSRSE